MISSKHCAMRYRFQTKNHIEGMDSKNYITKISCCFFLCKMKKVFGQEAGGTFCPPDILSFTSFILNGIRDFFCYFELF